MMDDIDKRRRLDEEPFSFRAAKDGTVFISWNGGQIMTLKGEAAEKLKARTANAGSQDVQLALAKATGNFNHGNEQNGKRGDGARKSWRKVYVCHVSSEIFVGIPARRTHSPRRTYE